MSDILKDIAELRHTMLAACEMPSECAVAPDVYAALRAVTESQLVYRPAAETGRIYPDTVFGLKVVVDPTMRPGEWKLVPPPAGNAERTGKPPAEK